jgi:hypothetical protein
VPLEVLCLLVPGDTAEDRACGEEGREQGGLVAEGEAVDDGRGGGAIDNPARPAKAVAATVA